MRYDGVLQGCNQTGALKVPWELACYCNHIGGGANITYWLKIAVGFENLTFQGNMNQYYASSDMPNLQLRIYFATTLAICLTEKSAS